MLEFLWWPGGWYEVLVCCMSCHKDCLTWHWLALCWQWAGISSQNDGQTSIRASAKPQQVRRPGVFLLPAFPRLSGLTRRTKQSELKLSLQNDIHQWSSFNKIRQNTVRPSPMFYSILPYISTYWATIVNLSWWEAWRSLSMIWDLGSSHSPQTPTF